MAVDHKVLFPDEGGVKDLSVNNHGRADPVAEGGFPEDALSEGKFGGDRVSAGGDPTAVEAAELGPVFAS